MTIDGIFDGGAAVIGSKSDTIDGDTLISYAKLNATNHIVNGTSPNTAGTANTSTRIELDSNASSVDGAYDPAIVYIIAGIGIGQSRRITEYDGTNKYAYINRDWKVTPDNTSEYCVVMDAGNTHVNEGVAQGGSNDTITLNTLASAQNNLYLGQMIFIVAGTGADQARMVVGYNGATKVATTDSNWIVNPDNTSVYIMMPFPGFIHGTPSVDSASNILMRDVLGNKSDTIGGDSLVSLIKGAGGSSESHASLFPGLIWYADIAQADDTGDGKSPTTAKKTIGAAEALTSDGDKIKIKAGTYTEVGIDISNNNVQIEFEIGALVAPASGTVFTLSGASCSIVGMHKFTPAAGEIGLLISGAECHVEHGKIIGGAYGVRVTGSGAMINNFACGFQTVKSYDFQAPQVRMSDSSMVGAGATYGVSISAGADTGVIKWCTSAGHGISSFHIAAGSQDWTILNCSSGAGDGPPVDVDNASVWSGFTFDNLVFHTLTFDASGPTSENLFRIYGTVLITEISADVETVLAADIGNGYLELYDQTNTLDLTDSPGPSFNSLPVATYLHKIDDAGVQINIENSSQVRLYEDATKDGRDPNFQVTAKNGAATYLRLVYSDTGTSGALHFHCQWKRLTEAGFVGAV